MDDASVEKRDKKVRSLKIDIFWFSLMFLFLNIYGIGDLYSNSSIYSETTFQKKMWFFISMDVLLFLFLAPLTVSTVYKIRKIRREN